MKIAYIVPGTGDTFYCGNCFRDSSFLATMKKTEHEIIVVPMYLPLSTKIAPTQDDPPIFYGAVNMYLKQQFPVLRKMPQAFTNFLNSPSILKFASKQSGSTQATGLEEMTISMLNGENGNQADDLKILINWLKSHAKPDVVHLSNALLLGLAPAIKKELNIPVVCSLQDEDEWLDEMKENYQEEAWSLIKSNAEFVDRFISVSHYYSHLIQSKTVLPDSKINVIYNGVDICNYEQSENKKPVIGYMSKMNKMFGLDILVDAFILLKQDKSFSEVKLKITGGYSSREKHFVHQLQQKINRAGFDDEVEFMKEFNSEIKYRFLKNITVLSVPAQRKEAIGMHMIEACAVGVPVVMPEHGAYSEIVNLTQAGLLYKPNNPENLCKALATILSDKNLYNQFHNNCITGIKNHFDIKIQIEKLLAVYAMAVQSN